MPLSLLRNWPLPMGTGKRMWSLVRPRELAKRVKFSFSSGGSSLVLPVVKMASERPADTPLILLSGRMSLRPLSHVEPSGGSLPLASLGLGAAMALEETLGAGWGRAAPLPGK